MDIEALNTFLTLANTKTHAPPRSFLSPSLP